MKGASNQHSSAYHHLCEQLRAWREDAGMSQRELSHQLGKTHTYAQKCESAERRIDPLEFIDWCLACGVNPTKGISTLIPPQHR
ncbi:MAG: helix-turn-helix transcriptional regulator [Planctomycetota bacterium]